MSRVLTIGTFDLFHYGHLNLLRSANRMASGGLIVGVNDSEFVEQFKGHAPFHSNRERIENIRSLLFVDEAFIHYGRDFVRDDITTSQASCIAIGDDWRDRDYLGQLGVTQDWLDARGIRVVYLPRTPDVSSSYMREALGEGPTEAA